MLRSRTLSTLAVGALMTASLASYEPAMAAPASLTARVWVTTPDGTDKLSDLGTVRFGDAAPTAPTVVLDPTLRYQTMQGFGGAITDSAATVLYRLSPAARAAAMRSLFDPVHG